jgi:hypothetical protein
MRSLFPEAPRQPPPDVLAQTHFQVRRSLSLECSQPVVQSRVRFFDQVERIEVGPGSGLRVNALPRQAEITPEDAPTGLVVPGPGVAERFWKPDILAAGLLADDRQIRFEGR